MKTRFAEIIFLIFNIFAFTAITFVAAEFFYRLYKADEEKFELELTRSLTPKPYVFSAGFPGEGNVNEMGYRGDHPKDFQGDDFYRVFIVGGSTVYNGNPSIRDFLQTRLRSNLDHKIGKKTIVFNFGAVSSIAYQDTIRILMEITDYKPDLVIAYGGGNDVLPKEDSRVGYPHLFKIREYNPIWDSKGSDYPLLALMLYESHIARVIFKEYIARKLISSGQKVFNGSFIKSTHEEAYFSAISKAETLSRAYNFKLLVVLQPVKQSSEATSPTDPEITIAYQKFKESFKRHSLGHVGEFVGYLDLSEQFFGRASDVFRDDIHIFDSFKKEIAEKIGDSIISLEKEGKLRIP